jgi:4-hydroxy-tetrahydrodipicolinate reductase
LKLGLIGFGGMGRVVAERAQIQGHEIAVVVRSSDAGGDVDELARRLDGLDAVIDFSIGDAVARNVRACLKANVPLIEGTTGWTESGAELLQEIADAGGACVYAANFSIGVNLFYRIVRRAGELCANFNSYEPFLEEAHHRRKRDAPSGTALRLLDVLASSYAHEIPVASTRAGFIPGTHTVGFDSEVDQITLTHTARTRGGFADGALLAASWIAKRRGVYEFGEALDEIIREGAKGK